MKKSIVSLMSGKLWTAAGSLVLALLLANMNPAAAKDLAKVVKYAQDHYDKIVPDGECTDLVNKALEFAGAKQLEQRPATAAEKKLGRPDTIYTWGTRLVVLGRTKPGETPKRHTPKPGYIIQFENARFKSPDGSQTFDMVPRHTAIVESAKSSTVITVLHQNGPTKVVTRTTLDLTWIKSGSYNLWIPVAK